MLSVIVDFEMGRAARAYCYFSHVKNLWLRTYIHTFNFAQTRVQHSRKHTWANWTARSTGHWEPPM